MVINWIAKLVAGLIANRRPGEVAAGVAFGLLLALIPAGNLLWPLLFALTFFLKLNVGAEIAALGVLRLVVPAADPLLDELGFQLLTAEGLVPLWTGVFAVPVVPFTGLTNSMVMGGLVAGIILWPPAFFAGRAGVVGFRTYVQPRLARNSLVRAFTRIPLISRLAAAVRRFRNAYAAFG
ncbi:MAG: TIGR03546 family protein [Spirochaetota bacterium]